jgi:hypothetical protein
MDDYLDQIESLRKELKEKDNKLSQLQNKINSQKKYFEFCQEYYNNGGLTDPVARYNASEDERPEDVIFQSIGDKLKVSPDGVILSSDNESLKDVVGKLKNNPLFSHFFQNEAPQKDSEKNNYQRLLNDRKLSLEQIAKG